MANDRVMIKCDSCGAWKMLLKHMGGGLYPCDNGILPWLGEHGECHPHAYSTDLRGIPGFSLHCEGAEALDPKKQNLLPPDEIRNAAPADELGYEVARKEEK